MPLSQNADLVARYFAAVDEELLEDILALLTSDCVFSVETHGVRLVGHDQIAGMFHRLWRNHASVRHRDFLYVEDDARIAVQFQVENTELDGSVTRKSNCNFFDVENGRFARVAVYMAGENTLDSVNV